MSDDDDPYVSVENIRNAIAAAWMVDRDLAVEIAKRYRLYDEVCLRCGWEPIAAVNPTNVCVARYGALAYQLCMRCHYAASRDELVAQLERR